ncbi:MAG: beta-ketoacyl synthase N-terminal-like domain-containing protein [Mucinivorans sp.]
MGRKVIEVYCGANRIISSLGVDTPQNYNGVCSYTTNISRYGDNTPLCLINRDSLDCSALEDCTFAEQLSILALSDVVGRSGVSLESQSTLLILSTTKGNVECLNSDFKSSYLWKMADKIANHFGCANKPLIVSNACISGVAAIVIGARLIRQGRYDSVYVLGVDVVSEFVVSGFNSFKSISPTVCRPYDVSRDGLTLGEGCATLLLTNDRDLSDSKIVVTGGAMSDDANHISGPSRSGDGLFYAIDSAIKQSGIEAGELGFINTHGTGTSFNDQMESRALDMAALRAVACNSLKPYLGHTLGASGVIEAILAIEQLRHNYVFGVKGYAQNGLPFELNVSAKHREMEVNHCLKTASGFGGTNAALVLSKEAALKIKPNKDKGQISIVEAAHVEIKQQDDVPFSEYIRAEYRALGEPNMKFFKMDNLSKLAYVASCRLFEGVNLPYPSSRIGVVLANRSSSLDTDIAHQQIVDQHLPEGSSPAVFVYTLANIMAAEIAIKHKLQGELSLFIYADKNMEFIEDYSAQLISNDVCDAVVCGWCELLKDEYDAELKILKK